MALICQSSLFDVFILHDRSLGPIIGLDSAVKNLPLTDLSDEWSGVYFCPSFFTHHPAPFVKAKKSRMISAVAIHDLIPIRSRNNFLREKVLSFLFLLKLTEAATMVIANSEFVARSYLSKVVHNNVHVIHPRSRFPLQQCGQQEVAAERAFLPDREFIFYPVADDPRKNIGLCVAAAPLLASQGLSTAIGGGLSPRVIAEVAGMSREDHLHFLPHVSDAELERVYRRSKLVAVPSYDEGFSLPLSEACHLGCKVIASDIPAHREQLVDRRHLFDPHSIESFGEAVRFACRLPPPEFRLFDDEAELRHALTTLLRSYPRH